MGRPLLARFLCAGSGAGRRWLFNLAVAALFAASAPAQTPWYNTGWSNRKPITVVHTKVSGSSNLTNFPMLRPPDFGEFRMRHRPNRRA